MFLNFMPRQTNWSDKDTANVLGYPLWVIKLLNVWWKIKKIFI